MRTYIYIDGFNLYYRALKGTPHKLLDFRSLFTKVLQPHHQILKIKYFTALVQAKAFDQQKPIRQKTYLRALEKHNPEVEIYYGHFLSNPVRAPLANPDSGGPRTVEIIKTEEKGSDVNLAVHMLNDAWLNCYDCAVVVSNDSDLAESMRLIKHHHQKLIGLITPGKSHPSQQLKQHADFVRRIRTGALAASQFPSPIPGTSLHKPQGW